jgi:CcmD family protein
MINCLKKAAFTLMLALLSAGSSFAQEMEKAQQAGSGTLTGTESQPPVDMATGLYQSGKIYVVVIVLSVIMAGIFAYLVMLDRKVSRLEKES